MSPNLAAIQLRNQIFCHLDADLLDTANFLAGRLHALEPRNADSHHLLALTYYRLRRWKAAYDLSQRYGYNGRHLGCAYVFAQSCLQLGEAGQIAKFVEGTTALEKCKSSWIGKSNFNQCTDTQRRSLPDAAACWTLLGRLYRAHGDAKQAGDCYIEAHKSNPFVWDAFEGLCKVGADLRVDKMFQPTAEMVPGMVESAGADEIYTDEVQQTELPSKPLATQLNFNQQVFTPSADPFNSVSKVRTEAVGILNLPNLNDKGAPRAPLSDWDTPTTVSTVLDEDIAMGGVVLGDTNTEEFVPAAPARRPRPGQNVETGDRPRQPLLRGQSESTEDTTVASSHQPRKPSVGGHKRTISGQQPTSTVSNSADNSTASQPPRRSNRLFGQHPSGKSSSGRSTAMDSTAASVAGRAGAAERPAKTATGTKGRIGSTVGRVVSGNRKMLPPDRNEKESVKRAPSRNATTNDKNVPAVPPLPTATATTQQAKAAATQPAQTASENAQAEQEALLSLLSGFRDLAVGVYSTTRFDTSLAVRTLRSLPSAQRETPWVQSQLGKAYYESGDHKAAEEHFARALKLQPSRTEDMDVYSTILWHLKKDTALTFLCHLLADSDYTCAERWVAVGNAYSLSREHDQAIAAFKRATQIKDNYAYAWTLIGHEYIANEDLENALIAFRKAVAVDRRGYGGWYGLARTYERQAKLEDAERHYRIASSINPSNPTLLVCIGVILEKTRNRKAALANYTRALELAPNSALARFKKARCLMGMKLWGDALEELLRLRDQAPDEANVWFLLGKCYKGMGERGEALRGFTTALNLDVKAAPYIKEAMEALDEEDGEETEDD